MRRTVYAPAPPVSVILSGQDPGARQTVESIRLFLEEAGKLAGTPLKFFSHPGELLIETPPGPACAGCSRTDGPPCAPRAGVEGAGPNACPAGHELLTIPLPGEKEEIGHLVAVLPPASGGDSGPEVRSRIEPFLRQAALFTAGFIRDRHELDLMSEELATCYEELNLLYAVSERLARVGDLRTVLRYILEECQSTTGSDWAMLHLEDRCVLEVVGWAGELRQPGPTERQLLPQLATTIRHELMASALQPVLNAEEAEAELATILGEPARILAVPILVNGSLHGSLSVAQLSRVDSISTNDVKLMEALAEQVSLSVTNWELYENLREFLMNTVRCLVSAIDAKDSYTRGHSERVHHVSLLIGEIMGLPPAEMETLQWASILHDVGKMAVPETILRKPASLTEEEMSVIQEHPVRGCQVLSSISHLGPALEGIRHHHERYDGSGYPDGLRAEGIPLTARIISVADIFDALTSRRAYRQSLPPAEVRAYIRAAAGRQLDPQVVEAFDAVFPELVAAKSSSGQGDDFPGESEEGTHGNVQSDDGVSHIPHPVGSAD